MTARVGVVVPPESLDLIAAAAQGEGVSRTVWVRHLIEDALGAPRRTPRAPLVSSGRRSSQQRTTIVVPLPADEAAAVRAAADQQGLTTSAWVRHEIMKRLGVPSEPIRKTAQKTAQKAATAHVGVLVSWAVFDLITAAAEAEGVTRGVWVRHACEDMLGVPRTELASQPRPSGRKSRVIHVTLPVAEVAALKADADRQTLAVSAWANQAVARRLGLEPPAAPLVDGVRDIDEAQATELRRLTGSARRAAIERFQRDGYTSLSIGRAVGLSKQGMSATYPRPRATPPKTESDRGNP